MFVFRLKDLPPDPVYPKDLKELGYFINDNDQIRKISDPEQAFQFKINTNPRWNDAQREAMNSCIRTIVHSRLQDLGMTTLRVPLTASPKDPHVPILVSANLSTASRILVVFGEPNQDLGIWAYRSIGMEGINVGSAVSLVEHVLKPDPNTDNTSATGPSGKRIMSDTALILANTGQLIWHSGGERAITHASWLALPRRSAVDPPMTMTQRNKIPSNGNWQEHVECVFEEVLADRGRLVRSDARIDVIGVAEGGLGVLRYLRDDWSVWRPYISSICFSNPLHYTHIDLVDHNAQAQANDNQSANSDFEEDADPTASFITFLNSRCRAYLISDQPRGVPVPGKHEHGCNCYASGEALNIECVAPSAWREMVKWLDGVHKDPGYYEDLVEVRTVDVNGDVVGDGV